MKNLLAVPPALLKLASSSSSGVWSAPVAEMAAAAMAEPTVKRIGEGMGWLHNSNSPCPCIVNVTMDVNEASGMVKYSGFTARNAILDRRKRAPILTTRGNLMVHNCQCNVLKGASALISHQCSRGRSTLDDLRNRLLFPGQAPDSFLRALSRNIGIDAEVGKGCLRVVEAAVSTALTGHAPPVQYHYHSGFPKASPISPITEVFVDNESGGVSTLAKRTPS